MTEALAKAESDRGALSRFLSGSGCHPCDRSEAGHQLTAITAKIQDLTDKLNIYNGCDVSK